MAYYDRERTRQPLAPIIHPRDSQSWSTRLPSWIDSNWNAPDESAVQCVDPSPADDLDDPPIAQTADYTLERCHVETVCHRHEWQQGEWKSKPQRTIYRWELTFSDCSRFRFVSRAIAEMALSELLKIRKAKHPRPKYGKHSSENECVFFTDRKLQKLAADIPSAEQSADTLPIDTAA